MSAAPRRPAAEEKADTAADPLQRAEEVVNEIKESVLKARDRFVSSERFQKWVRGVFEQVDTDKSGSLDVNEVYIAILLLYLQINGVCKGARPPTRERVEELFKDCVPANQAVMRFDQFQTFCEFLCSQIASRVFVQMVLQYAVAPALGLLAMEVSKLIMGRVAPGMKEWLGVIVPEVVSITLVVSMAVSLLVPTLMDLVDSLVLHEAAAAQRASGPRKAGSKGFAGAVGSDDADKGGAAWCCAGRTQEGKKAT